jgi:hypothetical protein
MNRLNQPAIVAAAELAARCPQCGERFAEFLQFEIADFEIAAARFSCLTCSPDFEFLILYAPIVSKAAPANRPRQPRRITANQANGG